MQQGASAEVSNPPPGAAEELVALPSMLGGGSISGVGGLGSVPTRDESFIL